MDTPEHLGAQEVPTEFRVGDTIRVNVTGYAHYGIKQWSEHKVTGTLDGYVQLSVLGGQFNIPSGECSFVQRAPAMSHDRHREEEIIGGGHQDKTPWSFPGNKSDAAIERNREDAKLRALMAGYGAPAKDMVNLPDHYARFPIEPIRFVVENAAAFKDPRVGAIMAHVIPYLLRHEFKGGIQDLEKAIRLLHMLMKLEQGDPDWWRADRKAS